MFTICERNIATGCQVSSIAIKNISFPPSRAFCVEVSISKCVNKYWNVLSLNPMIVVKNIFTGIMFVVNISIIHINDGKNIKKDCFMTSHVLLKKFVSFDSMKSHITKNTAHIAKTYSLASKRSRNNRPKTNLPFVPFWTIWLSNKSTTKIAGISRKYVVVAVRKWKLLKSIAVERIPYVLFFNILEKSL